MKPKQEQLDTNGKVKAEFRDLILPDLLARCPDFAGELTALKYLCECMSDDDCQVRMKLTPKYDCKIAALGIELIWGCIKRYYQRYLTWFKKRQA